MATSIRSLSRARTAADVYNQVPIEYVNRADQYNVETYQAFDDGLVDVYGSAPLRRCAPTM